MRGQATMYHTAISVDVDRFPDARIESIYMPLLHSAFCPDVRAVRRWCDRLRRLGYEVFPPCAHTDARGMCKGHPVEER